MKHSSLQGGLALSLVLALAACGGGSGGSSEAPHQDTRIDTAGRLAMAEDAAVAFGGAPEAAQAAPVAAAAPRTAPPVAQEINGLAIVWALIKNWWLGLFGKKT